MAPLKCSMPNEYFIQKGKVLNLSQLDYIESNSTLSPSPQSLLSLTPFNQTQNVQFLKPIVFPPLLNFSSHPRLHIPLCLFLLIILGLHCTKSSFILFTHLAEVLIFLNHSIIMKTRKLTLFTKLQILLKFHKFPPQMSFYLFQDPKDKSTLLGVVITPYPLSHLQSMAVLLFVTLIFFIFFLVVTGRSTGQQFCESQSIWVSMMFSQDQV